MSWLPVAHLVLVCTYAGFQWTVQVVVYPQFARVPVDRFAAYELAHQRRVSWLVVPLFGGLVLTTAGLVTLRPDGVPPAVAAGAAALLAALLGVTGLLAVPLHRKLSTGWDDAAFRRLLRVDALRVLVATANVGVGIALQR